MQSLIIKTDISCSPRDLYDMRDMVNKQAKELLGEDDNRFKMFNNHELPNKYSHIHYRCHYRKFVIFGWGEAVDVLKDMIIKSDPDKHPVNINNCVMKLTKNSFTKADKYQYYRLMDWVPMDNETYNTWKQSYSMTERLKILNNAINGNLKILASIFMTKDESQKVEGELFMIHEIKTQEIFGNNVIGCNVIFKTRYHLPENFALGRNVSLGVGTYKKLRNNPEDQSG